MDLLQFLNEGLKQLDFAGDINLFWSKKERTFLIELTFYAQNNVHEKIMDINGIISDTEVIEFNDSILLYDKRKYKTYTSKEYLITLPFEGKKGWTKKYGVAFLAYLQKILDDGYSDLLDFLNENQNEFFELKFDMKKFEEEQEKRKNITGIIEYPRF